jgi:hypothetical protein
MIFYETARSMSKKVEFIEENNFKGIGSWTLSQLINNGSSPVLDVASCFNLDTTSSYTGIDAPEVSQIPSNFVLNQNFPNPFNPSTTIRYSIGSSSLPRESVPIHREVSAMPAGRGVLVQLKIYNILGQEVTTIVNEVQSAGIYTVQWNGKNSAGQNVGSGVYFYQLKSDSGFLLTKKMMMLK